ncbi:MAG: helicase [Chrysothrix sp. TS-e1954]|nr:MAG: helicase [Chrysothrix sp. TS-e1954]
MLNKPFKTPLLRRLEHSVEHAHELDQQGPPTKRQKRDAETARESEKATASGGALYRPEYDTSAVHRRALHTISKPVVSQSPHVDTSCSAVEERYYNVLWRKPSTKKHKTWDGDGVLIVLNGLGHLQDESGRSMGKTPCSKPLLVGSVLTIGGKDVEVESLLSRKDFLAGKTFLGPVGKPTVEELEEQLRPAIVLRETQAVKYAAQVSSAATKDVTALSGQTVERTRPLVPCGSQTKALQSHFKNPLLDKTVLNTGSSPTPVPRHDPYEKGALVMRRPLSYVKGKQIVDVVIDPHIVRRLRDHQREGVKFMYECVMGMRSHGGEGAILADEMGLGKTLQVIALLWTLFKQNPVFEDPPVIKKALIVCPVTLIKNWRKEIRKWLGAERIGVFVVEDNKKRITDFTMGRAYSIMIIGYERLCTVQAELQKGSGIDIVIADEGHRLKTAQNKSAQAIKSLSTERRIILSGTPLQNDLSEFYFMVDFVNPGLLDKPGIFKREFEAPILRSRQPEATAKDIEKGEAKSAKLAALTSKFILRRTADILAKYLPPKTETVLFCRPTQAQAAVYRKVLASPAFGAVLGSSETSLKLISVLKKLCNSPSLLKSNAMVEEGRDDTIAALLSDVAPSLLKSPGASGKLQVLDSLLYRLRSSTEEKIVIVSNYTATLDILGNLLTSLSYSFVRLDGSTASGKRQDLVDRFNKGNAKQCFAFLLSAKAGGAGLNLIGASRLVLFDVDWNPSTDLQAMARIHRDGQTRPCKIYRLLTMGALDEKIYQRQLMKRSLADSVVDNKVSASTFTRAELRRLFAFDESAKCQTHELLGCMCASNGSVAVPRGADFVESDGSQSKSEIAHESRSESGLDDEGLNLPALINASKVDMVAQERKLKEQCLEGKAHTGKFLELMQYQHFDMSSHAAGIDAETAARMDDDDVLYRVLTDKENRVAYMFVRTIS